MNPAIRKTSKCSGWLNRNAHIINIFGTIRRGLFGLGAKPLGTKDHIRAMLKLQKTSTGFAN